MGNALSEEEGTLYDDPSLGTYDTRLRGLDTIEGDTVGDTTVGDGSTYNLNIMSDDDNGDDDRGVPMMFDADDRTAMTDMAHGRGDPPIIVLDDSDTEEAATQEPKSDVIDAEDEYSRLTGQTDDESKHNTFEEEEEEENEYYYQQNPVSSDDCSSDWEAFNNDTTRKKRSMNINEVSRARRNSPTRKKSPRKTNKGRNSRRRRKRESPKQKVADSTHDETREEHEKATVSSPKNTSPMKREKEGRQSPEEAEHDFHDDDGGNSADNSNVSTLESTLNTIERQILKGQGRQVASDSELLEKNLLNNSASKKGLEADMKGLHIETNSHGEDAVEESEANSKTVSSPQTAEVLDTTSQGEPLQDIELVDTTGVLSTAALASPRTQTKEEKIMSTSTTPEIEENEFEPEMVLSEDLGEMDVEFAELYEKAFNEFLLSQSLLQEENPEMVMFLKVAKLQKLFEDTESIEQDLEEGISALNHEKDVMTANYQRELLQAAKDKATREIELQQELQTMVEATRVMEGRMKWKIIEKNEHRSKKEVRLLQKLWNIRTDDENPIAALPTTLETLKLRELVTCPPNCEQLSEEQEIELVQYQVDNAFLNAEVSVLEKKLAYQKEQMKKHRWVESTFRRIQPEELSEVKHRFQESLGISLV